MSKVPLIALVGRPNVGKSTLFNRLVGYRASIVYDTPGVTRDRIFDDANIDDKHFRVVDTGGIEVNSEDPLLNQMRLQTQLAVEEADLIVFVVDGRDGVTEADKMVASLLRKADTPTICVANKIDSPLDNDRALEFYEFGFETVIPLSAEHAWGFDILYEHLVERLPAPEWVDPDNRVGIEVAPEDEEITGGGRIEWDGGRVKVAVVGRPNAGKSSLINKLIGADRLLASDIAGTTRDSVDIEVEEGGRIFQFVDTAGIRRKRSVADQLEKFAVYSAIRSMESADVTILVLDASLKVSEQDAKIASLALERGKGLVVVANKWDLMSSDEERDEFHTSLEKRLSFLKNAPKLQLSALTGRSVHRLFPMLVSVQQERHRRIGTAELNRFFKAVIEAKEPAMKNGRRPKILYGSQPMICPPTFVFMTKRPEDIEESYRRYVENSLRDRYGFAGTPVWVKWRESKQNLHKAPTGVQMAQAKKRSRS